MTAARVLPILLAAAIAPAVWWRTLAADPSSEGA
jgi:hypothetical protein